MDPQLETKNGNERLKSNNDATESIFVFHFVEHEVTYKDQTFLQVQERCSLRAFETLGLRIQVKKTVTHASTDCIASCFFCTCLV